MPVGDAREGGTYLVVGNRDGSGSDDEQFVFHHPLE